MDVTFRPLVDTDVAMMHGWLNEPGVVQWWEGDDVSLRAVEAAYGPANAGSTEHWVAQVDGHELGWIQCYPVAEWPQEAEPWAEHGVRPDAAGIDYLIGDPANRGRGLGSAMIAAFVRSVVFEVHRDWSQVASAPSVENVASWRALEGAGFVLAGTIIDATGAGRLMVRERPSGG